MSTFIQANFLTVIERRFVEKNSVIKVISNCNTTDAIPNNKKYWMSSKAFFAFMQMYKAHSRNWIAFFSVHLSELMETPNGRKEKIVLINQYFAARLYLHVI